MKQHSHKREKGVVEEICEIEETEQTFEKIALLVDNVKEHFV